MIVSTLLFTCCAILSRIGKEYSILAVHFVSLMRTILLLRLSAFCFPDGSPFQGRSMLFRRSFIGETKGKLASIAALMYSVTQHREEPNIGFEEKYEQIRIRNIKATKIQVASKPAMRYISNVLNHAATTGNYGVTCIAGLVIQSILKQMTTFS